MASEFIQWFRDAAPYINAHAGRTFVVQFDGEILNSPTFTGFIHDLVTLDALGVRLVLVHGARPQIDDAVRKAGGEPEFIDGRRLTSFETLQHVKRAVGETRLEIEAKLSMGVANSPMHGAGIRVSSGNYVVARPLGVRAGTDFGYTGEVRRVDVSALRACASSDQIALLSPLGFSPTGEIFNLTSEEVATAAAIALNAAKLIMVSAEDNSSDAGRGTPAPEELTLADARAYLHSEGARLASDQCAPARHRKLSAAAQACGRGVTRTHVLDGNRDGVLLQELFTRDGVGIMVSADTYDDTRQATVDDVAGILELIAPMEDDGILVRRSRDKLESEIDRFTVMERDGMVVACAALYVFDGPDATGTGAAELACLAVHPDYRNGDRGDVLIAQVENQARALGANKLFVLTTHTIGWFAERGFTASALEELPVARQVLYNYQRNSKVLSKVLTL
jgi:amino-acid N-acetyltransferase